MITRIEEWCEQVLEARWFQWLLAGSVIYAAAWWFFLPRGGMFDAVMNAAVGVWAGVFLVMIGGVLLAVGRGIKEYFLPWDGRDRRWRDRRQAAAIGRAVGKS